MRLRTAEIIDVERRSSPRQCESTGCVQTTRGNKEFCSDHVDKIPYVIALAEKIARRDAQDSDVASLGSEVADLESVTAIDLLRYLYLNGPRTKDRCVRDLILDPRAAMGYMEALGRQKLVELGETKRGSVFAKITEAGRGHLDAMRVIAAPAPVPDPPTQAPSLPAPAPSLPAPAPLPEPENCMSASDARLPSEKTKPTESPVMHDSQVKKCVADLRAANAKSEAAFAELVKARSSHSALRLHAAWSAVVTAEAKAAAIRADLLRECLVVQTVESWSEGLEDGLSGGLPKASVAKKPAAKKAAKSIVQAKKPRPSLAFASWLRTVRSNVGLSQVVFGEKIGASETQMWHWEKGNRFPNDEFVVKIEKLVGKTCPYRQKAPASAASA